MVLRSMQAADRLEGAMSELLWSYLPEKIFGVLPAVDRSLTVTETDLGVGTYCFVYSLRDPWPAEKRALFEDKYLPLHNLASLAD